jgi:hypothetical protein
LTSAHQNDPNVQTILNFSKKKKIKFFGNAAATAFPNVPLIYMAKKKLYIDTRMTWEDAHISGSALIMGV